MICHGDDVTTQLMNKLKLSHSNFKFQITSKFQPAEIGILQWAVADLVGGCRDVSLTRVKHFVSGGLIIIYSET